LRPSCEAALPRPITVIASVSEAIHRAESGKVDCFAALAMTDRQTTAISPHALREVSFIFRPLDEEGAGNTGRLMRPQPRVR